MTFDGTAEAIFVVGILCASIVPRDQWDTTTSDWIGGGSLSRRFREALVVLYTINIIRHIILTDPRHLYDDDDITTTGSTINSNNNRINNSTIIDNNINTNNRTDDLLLFESLSTFIYYLLFFIETFGLQFLMMLTPYYLQCHLSSMINIRPGKNLVPWLYSIAVLQLIGLIGSAFINKKLYIIKRIGDIISSIPILHTLSLYQRTIRHRDPRVVTLQTVQTIEQYYLFLTIIVSGMHMFDHTSSYPQIVAFSNPFHTAYIYITHTRRFLHALLLNLMDEAVQISTNRSTPASPTPTSTATPASPTTYDFSESYDNSNEQTGTMTQLVPLHLESKLGL